MNTTVDVLVQRRPDPVALRRERIVLRALEQVLVVGESRRRFPGTNVSTKAEADVVTAPERDRRRERMEA